jgi:cardiolipin synthase
MLSYLLLALHVVLATAVSSHIILTKADVRAAIGWTGLVWLTPVVGSVLYFFLGINLIRRSADRMRHERHGHTAELRARRQRAAHGAALLPPVWRPLATLTGNVSAEPLTEGNSVQPLENGDEAYPAMIAAIASAKATIGFSVYIFDRGVASAGFVDALAAAVERGVDVRVLIDDVGAKYSRPSMLRDLRARGIRVAQFLPSPFPFSHPYFHLRNHRKILVVDGCVGFAGGINVRDACLLANNPPYPTRDVHFRFEGPVVRQMVDAFAADWRFTTREEIPSEGWCPDLVEHGDVLARGIADGPDEANDALLLTLQGALSEARQSVWIVTPYFLPEPPLLDALRVTALRGVDVRILVPENGNLRLVTWAMQKLFARVLQGGCKVGLTRAPFDHSKLMVIDGTWSLIGSANWDPRSLRLNFEYVVECWSESFAAELLAIINEKARGARWISSIELASRPRLLRLRDGVAWLAQPYL